MAGREAVNTAELSVWNDSWESFSVIDPGVIFYVRSLMTWVLKEGLCKVIVLLQKLRDISTNKRGNINWVWKL